MQGDDEIASLLASIAPEASTQQSRLAIPQHITASRDWSLSYLAHVMTDRVVFDDNFITHMLELWGPYLGTRISPIARNTYLIEFVSAREMYEVLRKEPWIYRTDIVSMHKVHEPSQLRPDFVNHIALWTQFHNVPPEMLSVEGITYLAQDIGTPISEVKSGYNADRLFMRVKISFNADKGLQDRLPVTHPTLGEIPVYLVYERVARLCPYCVYIGHDLAGCPKRGHVLQLCVNPAYATRTDLLALRNHRKGVWMNCPALVPRPMPEDMQHDTPPYMPYVAPDPNPLAPGANPNPLHPPADLVHPTVPYPLLNQRQPAVPMHNSLPTPHAAADPFSIPTKLLPGETQQYTSNPNQASPLHPSSAGRNHLAT